MSTTSGAKTSAADSLADRAVLGWQMWIPCMGMAACSWLAFVDRQVLAVLSPTILKETGLSAQDYGTAFSSFLPLRICCGARYWTISVCGSAWSPPLQFGALPALRTD